MEELQKRHGIFNFHKTIKKTEKDGNLAANAKKKTQIWWAEHVQILYEDDRNNEHGVEEVNNGLKILPEEIVYAIKLLNNEKASRLDKTSKMN